MGVHCNQAQTPRPLLPPIRTCTTGTMTSVLCKNSAKQRHDQQQDIVRKVTNQYSNHGAHQHPHASNVTDCPFKDFCVLTKLQPTNSISIHHLNTHSEVKQECNSCDTMGPTNTVLYVTYIKKLTPFSLQAYLLKRLLSQVLIPKPCIGQ